MLRIPSAVATTVATWPGSRTAASSASHTPSANRPATRLATSPASRVFPAPPGPVIVTRRYWPSWPAISSTTPARPTKLVSSVGNPCILSGATTTADPFTAVTLTAAHRDGTAQAGCATPSALPAVSSDLYLYAE